jgi:hypothetical protein
MRRLFALWPISRIARRSCRWKERGCSNAESRLYKAILLVHRGIYESMRGSVRLKRSRDSVLIPTDLDDNLTLFELHRALLKSYFCEDVESCERLDEIILRREVASAKARPWMKSRSIRINNPRKKADARKKDRARCTS